MAAILQRTAGSLRHRLPLGPAISVRTKPVATVASASPVVSWRVAPISAGDASAKADRASSPSIATNRNLVVHTSTNFLGMHHFQAHRSQIWPEIRLVRSPSNHPQLPEVLPSPSCALPSPAATMPVTSSFLPSDGSTKAVRRLQARVPYQAPLHLTVYPVLCRNVDSP